MIGQRATGTLDNRLAASPAAMRAELAEFATAVLARLDPTPEGRRRTALEVFNTEIAGTPTTAEIVERILANPLNAVAPLVHAAGPPDGRPVFLVHGADGELGWALRHLSGLPLRRPVCGLISPGWYGRPGPGSVTELAAGYLREVRARQPDGPYTLGGYSAGGAVALEMGRHLEACGETVDSVLLIDPPRNEQRMRLRHVLAFRLRQLRERRHPVMAPYVELADHATLADLMAMLELPALPDEPVRRRFCRGLLVLVANLTLPPAGTAPLRAGGALLVSRAGSASPPNERDPLVVRARRALTGGVRVLGFDAPHNRAFEDPVLHRVLIDLE